MADDTPAALGGAFERRGDAERAAGCGSGSDLPGAALRALARTRDGARRAWARLIEQSVPGAQPESG
jgi:hypothetical protein